MGDVTVIGGGIIPQEDIPPLKAQRVKELFLPGTDTRDVVKWIEENVKPRNL